MNHFQTTSKLTALRALSALPFCCWRVSRRITDDTLALQALTIGLQEHHTISHTDNSAIELLQRYRAAVKDSSIAEDLEFERLCIDQDTLKRDTEPRMQEAFG